MQEKFFEFRLATRIVFEPGALGSVGREASRLGIRRAFVVVDPVGVGLGFLEKALAALGGEDVAVAGTFSDIPPDSDRRVVESLGQAMRSAAADGIVAIGGGSALDTGKAADILLSMGGRLADYEGAGILPDRLKPMILVPTTAGTGAEVSFAAMVKDHEAMTKTIFYSPALAADVAILDPLLTVSLPARLTASTAMDAMTHAIEAVMAVNANPFADAMAYLAMRKIFQFLPRAVREPQDLDARGELLVAATAGGAAFSNAGVGIVHAMAHACGAIARVHHGTATAILLPHGMRFNLEALPERRRAIAHALGVREESVIEEIARFSADCGLPARLREVGVTAEHLDALAAYAETDGSIVFNPRPASKEEIRELLAAAL